MTLGRILSGLKKTIKAWEKRTNLSAGDSYLADIPDLKYKKDGSLTKRSEKALQVWADVKRAKLAVTERALKIEEVKQTVKRWEEEIWFWKKFLREEYQMEMGYTDKFVSILESAIEDPKRLPIIKKNLTELDDLRQELNALLYEAQLWQSHEPQYRLGVSVDYDIMEVLRKISSLMGFKVEIVEAWGLDPNQDPYRYGKDFYIDGVLVQ